MTKEASSTFLPIVNIAIRAKLVKSKAANPEIQQILYSIIFKQSISYRLVFII